MALSDYQTRQLEVLAMRIRELGTELKRFNDNREPTTTADTTFQLWFRLSELVEHHDTLASLCRLFESVAHRGDDDALLTPSGHPVMDTATRLDTAVLREIVSILEKLDGDRPIEGYLTENT